ncbi:MAG: hypothetical protein IH968_13950 [Gemmatimonadetes bacterium]|nr:hypothetical protein [Gemmatimonadota bacterium]
MARDRPLGTFMFAAGVLGTLYAAGLMASGSLYVGVFDGVDATTLLMLGILLARGVVALRYLSDLEAFALTLVAGLSFIFVFEAFYKFLFFGWLVDPTELRALLLQVATAGTVLTGFARGSFGLSRTVVGFLGLYLLAMLGWLGAGFPQLFDVIQAPPELAAQGFEIPPQIVMAEPFRIGVWLVNRFAKASLFLAFFFVFRTRGD